MVYQKRRYMEYRPQLRALAGSADTGAMKIGGAGAAKRRLPPPATRLTQMKAIRLCMLLAPVSSRRDTGHSIPAAAARAAGAGIGTIAVSHARGGGKSCRT